MAIGYRSNFMAGGTIPCYAAYTRTICKLYLTYSPYLVPISLGSLGICMLMVSICNALVLPMRALVISGLRLFVCFLPLLWLGAKLAGLHGLFVGAMLGNFAAGIMAWVFYQQGIKKVKIKYCDRHE